MKRHISNNRLTNYNHFIELNKNEYCRLGEYSLMKTRKGFSLERGHIALGNYKSLIDGIKAMYKQREEFTDDKQR